MSDARPIEILNFIRSNANCATGEIHKALAGSISQATVKRILSQLLEENLIISEGLGKGRRYFISPSYELLYPIDLDSYYEKEIDERQIKESFNFGIFDLLDRAAVFNELELSKLVVLQEQFRKNTSLLSELEYKKELERLAIDLSWKSSQIEGNTYSLLETERLLKDKKTAAGKTKEEAVMLLNHKDAIDFIVKNPDYLMPLRISSIEDIHSILVMDLAVNKNLRKRRVGISGNNYKPL